MTSASSELIAKLKTLLAYVRHGIAHDGLEHIIKEYIYDTELGLKKEKALAVSQSPSLKHQINRDP